MEEENNKIEQHAAQTILDRGVRYKLPEGEVVVRPLKFGTILMICEALCRENLTLQAIDEGEDNIPDFIVRYGRVMLECLAMAMLNEKKALEDEGRIKEKAEWIRENLTAFQVRELFVFVRHLSGITDFASTIRLLWMIKKMNLSPREQGS